MDLERPEQYQFILTCDQREAEVVRAAIAQPAMQGAREDYERAIAHEGLQRTLPPVADPWRVAVSAIELIAIHRATRNLQYRPQSGEEMRNSAAAFTAEIVERGYEVKYYLA